MKEFEQFTDAEKMRDAFQRLLPGFTHGNPEIRDCRLLHTRFKTYRREQSRQKSFLAAAWQLVTANQNTGQQAEHLLYGKAYLGGRSRAEFEKAMNRRLVPVSNGAALTHLAALDLVVWSFPNDPAMPHLPEVIDPHRVRQHLPFHSLKRNLSSSQPLTGLEVKVINYRPEERCTTRYWLNWSVAGRPAQLMLYAKTFADQRGAGIHHLMLRLWEQAQREPDFFVIARPVAYDEGIKTIWQEGLNGAPLADALNEGSCRELMRAVGRGLAALQRSNIECAVSITLDDHLAEVKKKADKLMAAFPHLRDLLSSLTQRLSTTMPDSQSWSPRVIHGDFHLRQLLLSDGRIALFDFDELAAGDALQDLANFIADLPAYDFNAQLRRRIETALLEGWQQAAGSLPDRQRLLWHVQVQFITRAYRSYWQRKPDLENVVRQYLTLAAQAGDETEADNLEGRWQR